MSQRVCCLYRVSTNKQVDRDQDNNADIPMQRRACHSFASRMGWEIVREEQENGVSGFKVSAADRDKIQLIKTEAQKGSFDILLVFMFDRLGRKSDETPFVVEWFVKHNVQVWSVQEGEQRFESHTDRLTNYIRFWQADGESQKTSMRTKTALSQMVQDGRFRGGTAPYGYRLENSGIFNKRKHEVKKLVIDEEESKVVSLIFSLCAGSGYGRFRICTYLNDLGIRNRKGETWHESSVNNILRNITYTGILHSGETYSEIFPEIQIIDPSLFELIQKNTEQRRRENRDKPHVPRNTKGQALLSGNVFCGHCGGRLNLTTSGKVAKRQSPNEPIVQRIRYACYNKTRKRVKCDGQSGYTSHLLDSAITDVLHQLFRRMNSIDESELISRTKHIAINGLKEQLTQAKAECNTATKEYEALKLEVVKAVQGISTFPTELLSELTEKAREKMMSANETFCELQKEIAESDKHLEKIKREYQNLLEWSRIFDTSDMAVKKMIAAYIIHSVHVHAGYQLSIKFNINIEQFELGLENETSTTHHV